MKVLLYRISLALDIVMIIFLATALYLNESIFTLIFFYWTCFIQIVALLKHETKKIERSEKE